MLTKSMKQNEDNWPKLRYMEEEMTEKDAPLGFRSTYESNTSEKTTIHGVNYGKEPLPDNVNSPNHYTKGGIECIEAIKASMTPEEFSAYCKGCIIKYLWRYKNKGKPIEDLEKAQLYQKWLLSNEKGEQNLIGVRGGQ